MMIMASSKIKPPIAAGPNPAHPLADRLAGCWLLNEGMGQVVHDLSGYHHDGHFSGEPSWQGGSVGPVIAFDGVDDWISMGNCLDLGTDDVTVLALVQYSAANQPDEVSGSRIAALAGKGHIDAAGNGYGLRLHNNRIMWRVQNLTTVFEVGSDTVLNDGLWHTAIGVCDRDSSTGLRLYIDGVLQTLAADPTSIDGMNISGTHAFAIGARQEASGGTWWGDFLGRVGAVMVWNRVLTENQIVELQHNLFALFARRRSVVCFVIPTGTIKDIAGTTYGVSFASATLQAVRDLSGVCAVLISLVGVLRKTNAALLQDQMSWRRAVLFNGITPTAFILGTVLTQGWFWLRSSGCAVVYRGPTMAQVDVNCILHVANAQSAEISLPADLSPPAGSACCYILRRVNSSGCQEQTTKAAVMVRIGPNGVFSLSAPNSVYHLKGERVGGRKVRLTWFYSPLDQETAPQEFNIYGDVATSQIDLEHPIAAIPYNGHKFHEYETVPLDDDLCTFAIRPCSVDQAESVSVAAVLCPRVTFSPEASTILSAQAI